MIAGVSVQDLEAATRSVRYRSYFAPLPETRSEVSSIAGLNATATTETLLGKQALESRVKSAPLSRYRYLHFATHGILGGEVPGIGVGPVPVIERSSLIALRSARKRVLASRRGTRS